jgi:hypothetical protein
MYRNFVYTEVTKFCNQHFNKVFKIEKIQSYLYINNISIIYVDFYRIIKNILESK